jgi:hypothetical protein
VPEPPATAAVEIKALYANFAAMAERIERRSRYLKDFAAAVSHEFKTPIAGIRGALELLADHGETMSGEERDRFIANAMADADRLSHLLQRLLAQARADMAVAAEGTRTPLGEPVAAVADAHRGPTLEIEVDVSGALPPVAAPPELIEAVLDTLVENSQQAGAGRVRIAAEQAGARVNLRISDDGVGVPEGQHERIFEPFHTSRRAQGGSGLGLSIARSLLASVDAPSSAARRRGAACSRSRSRWPERPLDEADVDFGIALEVIGSCASNRCEKSAAMNVGAIRMCGTRPAFELELAAARAPSQHRADEGDCRATGFRDDRIRSARESAGPSATIMWSRRLRSVPTMSRYMTRRSAVADRKRAWSRRPRSRESPPR